MSETDQADYAIETERYELRGSPAESSGLDRREFFKLAGAGLIVLLLANPAFSQESGGGRRRGRGPARPSDLGAWLHIGESGQITVFTGKAEVGQNIRTSLTQAVAEELRAPVGSITLIMADTLLTPYDQGTFGSRTTPDMVPQLRKVAASAREALLDLAADFLKADRASLSAADGKIIRAGGGDPVTYGQLTRGQKIAKEVSSETRLAPPADWKVEGTSVPKVDGRAFVTGGHKYASDIKLPGMLLGGVLRPPSFGAKLVSANLDEASALPGVKIAKDGDFIAVAAGDSFTASQALATIKCQWKETPQISHTELFDHLKKTAGQGAGNSSGSIEDGLASAAQKVSATYTVAYIAHTPLEPRAAVAEWKEGRLTVWTGTQRPFGVRSDLAQALEIPEEDVRVIAPDTGSGYGGKHTGEAALEAARLAKAAGQPVKIVWTREEEFTWAYARPAGVIDVTAGAKDDGTLVAWEFHNYNSGGSAIGTPYEVSNKKVQFHSANSPLKQGSYRGLAATANHFAREAAMDELAAALKMDPLDFRLKNLKNDRLRAVLQAAAETFGWGKSKPPANHGFGLSAGTEKGSYIGTCAEVLADRASGMVRTLRVTAAFECGAVINPDHLKNQVEGAIMMGIGGALFEALEFANGKVTNPKFSKYRLPRFSDAPKIEVVLLDRKDLPSAGAGETPIVGIAPAIHNAIFNATGLRLRSMPMAPQGLDNKRKG
jgi:isoquinoline 1-oxidoreductase